MDTNEQVLAQLREISAHLNALDQSYHRAMARLKSVEGRLAAAGILEETVTLLGMTTTKECIDLIHDQTPDGDEFVIRIGQEGIEIPEEVYEFLFEKAAK
jgi:hypothetical protein